MADFQSIIYQMILAVLRDAQITSANPTHTNKFKGLSATESSDIGLDEEIRAAIAEAVQNVDNDELIDTPTDESISESQAISSAKKGIGIASNPGSIVSQGLALLPHAALVALALSLVPIIFKELTRAGGIFDLRFKRILEDEFNAFLDRQTQKDTEMGTRQVIIQAKKGFTANHGLNSYNSMKGIREGGIDKDRLARIGLTDHAKGLLE